jgi:CDP-glucose 4,6-dehydratase
MSSFWQGKRVFLTGHTGFKGKWLTLLLDSLEIPYVGYSLAPATGSLYAICAENRKRNEKISDIREYDVLRKFFLEDIICDIFFKATKF